MSTSSGRIIRTLKNHAAEAHFKLAWSSFDMELSLGAGVFLLGLLGEVVATEFLLKSLDAACRVDELLGAGEERMAIGADFSVDLIHSASRFKAIAATTTDSTLAVLGVDIAFHGLLVLNHYSRRYRTPIIRSADSHARWLRETSADGLKQ